MLLVICALSAVFLKKHNMVESEYLPKVRYTEAWDYCCQVEQEIVVYDKSCHTFGNSNRLTRTYSGIHDRAD